MNNIVALIDVDGPLADFHGEARTVANKLFNLDLRLEDFTTWDVTDILPTEEMKCEMRHAISLPGFASRLQPVAGSVEAINNLRELCEVVFLTTPHPVSHTWAKERQDWLKQHFGAAPDQIIQAFRKYHVKGHLFLDDRPKNVEFWQYYHPDGHSLLWDMQYNRTISHLKRVSSWDEVFLVIRSL